MVVRMRATRSHTGNRRSHHALKDMRLGKCPDCSNFVQLHKLCENCGKYRGKIIIDVHSKITKKDKKAKAKAKNGENPSEKK